MKKLVIASIVSAMALTMAAPVFAADDVAKNTSNTQVNITIEAGAPSIGYDDDGPTDEDGNFVSITLPSVLPIVFKADGTTVTPDDFTIKNWDTTDVSVDNIYFETTNKNWEIHQVETGAKPGDYLLDKGHNYEGIEMLIGADGGEKVSVGEEGDENRIADLELVLEGVAEVGEENHTDMVLDFQVVRTIWTEESEVEGAFVMHVDFSFVED